MSKMLFVLATWLCVWLLVCLLTMLINRLFPGLAMPLRAGITTAVLVPLMVYWIIPGLRLMIFKKERARSG